MALNIHRIALNIRKIALNIPDLKEVQIEKRTGGDGGGGYHAQRILVGRGSTKAVRNGSSRAPESRRFQGWGGGVQRGRGSVLARLAGDGGSCTATFASPAVRPSTPAYRQGRRRVRYGDFCLNRCSDRNARQQKSDDRITIAFLRSTSAPVPITARVQSTPQRVISPFLTLCPAPHFFSLLSPWALLTSHDRIAKE
eukprot:1187767-Prorocentrum_minimum.AAC.3